MREYTSSPQFWRLNCTYELNPLEKLLPHSADYLVWGGLVVDFADPKGFKIFADYHEKLVDQGITGFKADECDRQPLDDTTPFNYPYCSVFSSGIDGEQMTQLYGQYYQKSILSVFEKKNLRTWSDVRATGSLAAPYSFTLYSDAYSQEEYLRQLLNASFAGQLWSPEIREAATYEELISRLGMAVFAPQICINAWFVPNPLWMQFDREKNQANKFLPESERKQIIAKVRELVELRMSLLPYLYSAFAKYHFTGLPPVRALPIEFPNDLKVRNVEDQYMFGDNIMVAPVLGSRSGRTVYMPAGYNWINFDSNKLYQGGENYRVNIEPGQTPIFVRENSIIPLAEPVQNVNKDTIFEITAYVYGNDPSDFELFEDDGLSYDYEDGKFGKLRLSWVNSKQKGSVKRTGNFQNKRYKIKAFKKVDISRAADKFSALPIAKASHQNEFAYKAIDGDTNTIWKTGESQSPGQWFILDLKENQLIRGISLNCGVAGGDYPREYEIYISRYSSFKESPVAKGKARDGMVEIKFPNTFGRYIKIVQTGSDNASWWSIAELKVHSLSAVELASDIHISDLEPVKSVQQFEKMKVNKSYMNSPLQIAGTVYKKGIGTHAPSEIIYELKPEYKRFVAAVGVDDNNTGTDYQGEVIFKVYVDDQLLAESPIVAKGQNYIFDIELPCNADEIRLVVNEANEGPNFDHANWVNSGFITK
ncbi:Alpha-xylosidase [Limihaloglobus sulfuriphilus]|uniref:Alpha-xylosidase n=1 Tax=Limihaloglobus sulfuriphilus TaxID=1851148 RepID=A0A1Q2MFH8_9BACT|nr:NPCBM/NEW2 domain-containing protein [Limihaloglobus sulfuriphilus]AQQ71308.1 Alpha-xylosidase [Limihaloglobus sulfuriphilus]